MRSRLAGIEEARPTRWRRMVHLGVGQDMGRGPFTAEFEAERHEGARRSLFDGAAPPPEPVKLTWVDLPEPSSLSVWAWFIRGLEQALRQAGSVEGLAETFAYQKRLRCVFQDDGAAGHQPGTMC